MKPVAGDLAGMQVEHHLGVLDVVARRCESRERQVEPHGVVTYCPVQEQ